MDLRFASLVGAVSLLAGGAIASAQEGGSATQEQAKKEDVARTATKPDGASLPPLRDLDLRHQVIQVDLKEGKASSSVVSVNVETGDSLSIEVRNAFGDVKTAVGVGDQTAQVVGTSVLVQFRDCGACSSRELARAMKLKPDALCPVYLLPQPGASGIVAFVGKSKDGDSAHIVVRGTTAETAPPVEVGIAVRLLRRHWSLSFSSGFAAFAKSDHRYSLRTIEGDDKNGYLERTTDAGTPYSLGVFAHYDLASVPLALSFGVGTEIPMKELSLLLGLSLKARTLPLGQSGYLTAGVALRPFARLANSLETTFSSPDPTKRIVSATTTDTALLTERRYEPALFVSVSFVFAGKGESEFSGHVAK